MSMSNQHNNSLPMENHDILSKINRQSGMTVPDGYFQDFQQRMSAKLPQQDWEKPVTAPVKRSRWQIIRPYVYMAAMFAGIWCMMNMFDILRPASSLDIAENPTLMSAIDNDAFYYNYCVADMPDTEIYDDLYEQGFNPDDIEF